jgi:hypothetical protein
MTFYYHAKAFFIPSFNEGDNYKLVLICYLINN